ncbi:hypothetical protein FSARC_4580 [Fusarium sarcochroum]|uniref:2EXR domain-containing protein n=1 Tax=Fusarium sarcochroum TaxID=1208366 RepID=A0A8H4XAG2_9HYPO|nr:hypothetical protein FSARC_4580 [Fusarium sarcochroum]
MALKSFHQFPRLPAELRIMIWKAALRPSDATRGALHHFHMVHHRNHRLSAQPLNLVNMEWPYGRRLPSNFHATCVPCSQHTLCSPLGRKGTRSAYFWDSGMWLACWESRYVIGNHFKAQKWKRLAGELRQEQMNVSPRTPILSLKCAWESDKHRLDVSTVVIAGKALPVATQPMKDLYVLRFASWDRPWQLQIDCRFENMFADFAFSPMARGFPAVANIGFEFDHTWWDAFGQGEVLPRWMSTFHCDHTPLGFLMAMLRFCAAGQMNARFWLIERKAER